MSTVLVEQGVNKYPEKRTSTEICCSVIIIIQSDVHRNRQRNYCDEGAKDKVTHSNRHHY